MADHSSNKNVRQDLQEFIERQAYLQDENRSEAVRKRHSQGQRTARENIRDLCDQDSFLEIASLIVAGQKGRKTEQELREQTPADGLIAGMGQVNGDLFPAENSKCFVLSYDAMVLAGTQGGFNHKKTDRIMAMVTKAQCPVVFFVEGGGGRPGDVDFDPIFVGGLDMMTWVGFAGLSGKIPRIAIASRYCFAGNAAIAGCADVIIATENTSLGMGGPTMIEGGGLGSFHPKEIGPAKVQSSNGVIDILVKDEAEAVKAAKKYLAYFQGSTSEWRCADQTTLRTLIPENRKFGYDVLKVIRALADEDSVLELRPAFARNMVTAFIRIAGRPMGLIANSNRHLGGAIDSNASDKAARFMQLCDAFGIPLLSLCDTPGFMVGPNHEQTALVRHTARMFTIGAAITVPLITVVLRKAYGLGAMAMGGGSLHRPFMTVSWPTGEFGAMGLEGAVKLGFKKELETAQDEASRVALYDQLVDAAYQKGKAIQAAQVLEFDEVIAPEHTRQWISTALDTIDPASYQNGSGRFVDNW